MRDSITVTWSSSVLPSDSVRGYIVLLHNTDHECERVHFRTCTNCLNLYKMGIQIQSFYLSCRLWTHLDNVTNETILDHLESNKEYLLYIVPVLDDYHVGPIRNMTVGTQCSDRLELINIRVSKKELTMLQFSWDQIHNNDKSGQIDYYVARLVNTRTNAELSTQTSNETVNFHGLEVCHEYCMHLSVVSGHSQSTMDIVCAHTLEPNPGVVILDDIDSGPSLTRIISWRYAKNDDCAMNYRVKVRNKYLNKTKEMITNYTTVTIDNLDINMVYNVWVAIEVTLDPSSNNRGRGKYSLMKEFYTGHAKSILETVLRQYNPSTKTLTFSWILDSSLIGPMIEFIVRVTSPSNKCVQSINYKCDSCTKPYKREYLSVQWIMEWKQLMECGSSAEKSYTRSAEAIGGVMRSLASIDNCTLSIHGLDLRGPHKLYEALLM